MGKKRGGKRHRSKGGPPGSEETEVAHAEEALEALEAGEEAEAQAAAQPSRRGDWLRKTEFGDYFERIKQLIEDCPFQGSLQFEAFVTSTVAEVLKRGLLVVSDQKCSRVVEKLMALLANFIAYQEGGRRPAFGSEEANTDEEKLQSRLRCLGSYLALLRAIAPVAPELAVHPNGSHVLQTLLDSIPAVAEFELQHRKAEDTQESQTVEDLFLFMLGKLRTEGGGWLQTMCCATGSHIFRSAVRAAAGIDCLVPAEVAGRRPRRRTRKECEETLLPHQVGSSLAAVVGKAAQHARLARVPDSFFRELLAIASLVTEAVSQDPFQMPFDAYAAPCIQVLILALRGRQQEEALGRLLDAIFCADKDSSNTEGFINVADALVDSPTGSRILELAITLLSRERFQMAFAQWLVKKVNELARGRFGNFVLQKVLQSSVFQAAHLKQFIQALDFGECLYAATSGVLWRCAEACRRLQSSFKEFARKMFEAVGAKGGSSTPYVWWCLLALCAPEELPGELVADKADGDGAREPEEDPQEEQQQATNAETSGLRLQDVCSPSGCSILLCLLSFPPATVQPLNAGFKKFVKTARDCKIAVRKWKKEKGAEPDIEIHPLLECMARNKLASRLIQQIADPSTTAIQSSSVQYLIRSLIPFLPSLSLDPIGGFVLTSVYNGATPEVKRQIVEALLPIEEELKTANYAAYMKCEVYRYTKSKEQWQARQEKRSKTRSLFKDIIAAPVADAEDEPEDKRVPQTLTEDPIAEQLRVEVTPSEKSAESESKKKRKRRKNGEHETEETVGAAADAEAAEQIEQIFQQAVDESRWKKKKRIRKETASDGQEANGGSSEASPLKDVKVKGGEKDPTLDAALFFIEGTSNNLSKRELARRRKLEAEKLEALEASEAAKKSTAAGRRKQ